MKSFIQIPTRYDVQEVPGGMRIICTSHTPRYVLRETGKVVGVDEILRLVEEHETRCH